MSYSKKLFLFVFISSFSCVFPKINEARRVGIYQYRQPCVSSVPYKRAIVHNKARKKEKTKSITFSQVFKMFMIGWFTLCVITIVCWKINSGICKDKRIKLEKEREKLEIEMENYFSYFEERINAIIGISRYLPSTFANNLSAILQTGCITGLLCAQSFDRRTLHSILNNPETLRLTREASSLRSRIEGFNKEAMGYGCPKIWTDTLNFLCH